MTLFHKIGIIGLGLMGGSIFKALQGTREILSGPDVLSRLSEIDLLILAVPISAIFDLAEKIAQQKPRGLEWWVRSSLAAGIKKDG